MDDKITDCECLLAGVCKRHDTYKTAYYVHLCRTKPAYFKLWESGDGPKMALDTPEGTGILMPDPVVANPYKIPDLTYGPGTELKAILTSLGISEANGCNCNGRARDMDRMGVQGCRDNKATLIAWLNESGAKLGWLERFKLAGTAASEFGWKPWNLVEGMIDLAIERAEEKELAAGPRAYCDLLPIGPEFMYECTVCHRKVQTPANISEVRLDCRGEDYLIRPTLWKASNYKRPPAPILTRDLMYHVYPDGDGHWKSGIQQLLKRWDLFNGKKVFGIVTGDGLADPEDVMAMLPSEVEYYIAPNENAMIDGRLRLSPNLRQEGVTFVPLLEKLMTDDPTRVLFRAHTKGGRYSANGPVHTWANIMYAVCLDDWREAERQLTMYPCTGPFKKHNEAFDRTHITRPAGETRYFPWFYSGSFYWLHTASLGGFPNWQDLEQNWFAVEPYPAQFWSSRQVGCLFGDRCGNMYSQEHVNEVVLPEFMEWKMRLHERSK